MIVLRDAFKVL